MAISAIDVAFWDLKARLLDLPLVELLGHARPKVPIYGSGGFTSYPVERLCDQLAQWVDEGIPRAKMKVGRSWQEQVERIGARARPSARSPSCSSTPTAFTAGRRPWCWRKPSRVLASPGSKSRSAPTTCRACGCCAIGLRWTSPRANMVTTAFTFGGCWNTARSTSCRPTPRGAGASPDFCRPPRCVRASACRCRPTARGAAPAPLLRGRARAAFGILSRPRPRGTNALRRAPQPLSGELAPDLSRPGLGLELKRADAPLCRELKESP